jgi:hypothetical protein
VSKLIASLSTASRVLNRRWAVATLASVAAIASACFLTTTTVPASRVVITPGFLLTPDVQTFCTRLAFTTCDIPEYTDDQRFMGQTPQTYGPIAYIAPTPNLDTYTSDTDFQGTSAKLVAFVKVGTGVLPATYTDLRLTTGFQCLYLRHDGTSFAAYMTPPVASNPPCTPMIAPDASRMLPVKAAVNPSSFPGAANIPPVARFREGKQGASAGVPHIGVRCGDKWCMVLPQGADVDTLPVPHKGEHPNRRTWAVHGWGDEQHIAFVNSTAIERSTHEGSVLPVPELGSITDAMFRNDFQHVATVRFYQKPLGKYVSKWNYKKGENEVWIKRLNDTDWTAEIRNEAKFLGIPYTAKHTVFVAWHSHGHPIPQAARFLWSDTDEDLWVACEDGCCKVSGKD